MHLPSAPPADPLEPTSGSSASPTPESKINTNKALFALSPTPFHLQAINRGAASHFTLQPLIIHSHLTPIDAIKPLLLQIYLSLAFTEKTSELFFLAGKKIQASRG